MRACALRGADNRTEVMRVRQLVADHNQGSFSRVRRFFQNIVDAGIVMRRNHGNHTLVCAGCRHEIELPPVGRHNHRARFLCHRADTRQRPVGVAVGNEELVDRSAGGKRLGNGVSAL